VFTSFPFNALDESDSRTAQLWRELLTTERASADWNDTRLGEQQNALLQQMIGRSVAPWQTAAIVVIGYTLLVLALQLVLRGTRRPVAFAVALSVAVGASLTLVILCHARRAEQRLGNASLTVIDAAPGGGGIQQQVTTYYGKNIRDMALTAAGPDVRFRPAFSRSSESPILEVQPFGVSNARAWADKVEQVWQATAMVELERRAEVTGRFGPDGLRLTVTNQFGQPLRMPLLIWQNRACSLPDVSLGMQEVVVGPSNRRGDYANAAAFTSDAAKLRGQILSASLAPRSKNGLATNISAVRADGGGAMVVGWLDEPGATRLLNSSPSLDDVRGQAMVRIPVMVEATPPEATVRIGEAFMRLDQGEQHGSPYDPVEELWPPSQQVGFWLVAFAPPREIGQLNPTEATLITILEAPQHTITIRRGQVSDGRGVAQGEPLGPIVAQWANQIGPKSVTFPLGPRDVDTNGRVWLSLQVEGVSSAAGGAPAQWRFVELGLSMRAHVTGPPVAPSPSGRVTNKGGVQAPTTN
jgi:hypothetical protein